MKRIRTVRVGGSAALFGALACIAAAPAIAAPLTCRWEEKQQCDPGAGCKPIASKVWVVADAEAKQYSRCDRNGCDSYHAVVTAGPGAYTFFDLLGRGMFLKLGPAGRATEVVTLGNSVLVSQGVCRAR